MWEHSIPVLVDCSVRGTSKEKEDDGEGFETNRAYPGHLGLQSMFERVARLGGTLQVDSAAGTGTRIRAVIPLQPERA
jgi:signal transduction histidine kinase